ncbi:MAG: hypothetical protein ACQEVA_17490 [Myxococcota bacterium]
MPESIHERIQRLVREILTVHFELFPVLLADKGVSRREQRMRLDALARALMNVRAESNVSVGGRPVPFAVDSDASPPVITVNEKLVAQVDDDEFLYAFHQPISELLRLSPVTVGLVLQTRDDRQLRSLYSKAMKKLDGEAVRLTTVPAVVEQRIQLFENRLGRAIEAFGESAFVMLEGGERFGRQLRKAPRGWPEWNVVRKASFIKSAVQTLTDALADIERAPDPEVIGELCWDSLDLSPQSFLRQAAQQLRSADGVDMTEALAALSEMVEADDEEVSADINGWSTYAALAAAWDELFRSEQRVLAWTPGRRRTPGISVFDPPVRSLRLNEPESLPWSEPLLSWSVREQKALKDLLTGLKRTLDDQIDEESASNVDWFTERTPAEMSVEQPAKEYTVEVLAGRTPRAENYDDLMIEALRANFGRMNAQFVELEPASQKRALTMLRSAYDGFFGEAKEVWKRRFQAIEAFDPVEAFPILMGELRHVLGTNVVFDPFDSPETAELRHVPTFVVVVAWPEGADSISVSLPLTSLRYTFQDTPVRLRLVQCNGSEPAWLGDLDIMMETIREFPTEDVLKAVENDRVQLMVEAQ